MLAIYEITHETLTISTDPTRLDLEAICDLLSRSYWANQRSKETISHTLQHSLCFGVYDGTRQIAFARVVSDYATFAWLCDVIVHEDYRGRGVGKHLMEAILAHPDLQTMRRFMLATRDAQGLYAQYGFKLIEHPERWMERFDPNC
jgi:N-acetylglutamate synthase-like GNAT family acetyltransferase